MYRAMDRGLQSSLNYAKVDYLIAGEVPLIIRSNTAESLSGTSQRRSSLYHNAQAGDAYLSAPGPGQ